MNVQERSFFRVTRDADFGLEQDEGEDLMLVIKQELSQRRVSGSVVRMEIQASTPASIRKILMKEMKLTEIDVYEIEGFKKT
jgi:polyphosphate kinase